MRSFGPKSSVKNQPQRKKRIIFQINPKHKCFSYFTDHPRPYSPARTPICASIFLPQAHPLLQVPPSHLPAPSRTPIRLGRNNSSNSKTAKATPWAALFSILHRCPMRTPIRAGLSMLPQQSHIACILLLAHLEGIEIHAHRRLTVAHGPIPPIL